MQPTHITILAAALCAAATGWGQPGGGSSSSVTYYATYKLDGGSATQSGQTYIATAKDTSAIWVTNSGALTLTNPVIQTSGNTSSQDNSSFYGLNAAVLATSLGTVNMTGGTITTTGTGANGVFAVGTGASITLSGVTINASADGGHAVMATQGGTLTLTNVNMTTSGGSSSAIATDRGSGTINVTGGTVNVSGGNSACIYSTGAIAVTGMTCRSTGAESAVIEGANSITLTGASMASTKEKWGVMVYQSMSGDAEGKRGVYTMTGGSLSYTPSSGPVFYVTNTTGVITLKGVTITSGSKTLLEAAAGNWGSSGSNGGATIFTADAQTLEGDMAIDAISSLVLTLKNGSSLTGAINNADTAQAADVTLDATSQWTLTADSYVDAFSDAGGVSGTSIANITGNGHNIYYAAALSANSYLAGQTYTLKNGGLLLPTGSVVPAAPVITPGGVTNAATYVAGMAPSAWIAIFGTNLATATGAIATPDLVNGYLPTTFGGASVTIGGQPAYIHYASPTQLNVQAPSGVSSGALTVTVTTSAGSSSVTATMQPVLPGVFTASNYALAVRWPDSVVINGTGAAMTSYTTAAAAKPGDILAIYATGLGATATTVPAGLVFSGAYPTTSTPTVTIGGVTAEVSFCGLVAAGEYQINLTVPATLATGAHAVVVTQDGVSSPSTAVLKVVAE
jgi:uncharacterized protein (TIGR03437 family)